MKNAAKIFIINILTIIFFTAFSYGQDLNEKLFNAVQVGNLEEVKKFVAQGADVNAKTCWQNMFGANSYSYPLHEAVGNGYLEITKFLVEQGANLNTKNSDGETPLHLAVKYEFHDIVKYLVKHGANKKTTDNEGKTPCDYAETQKVKKLLCK